MKLVRVGLALALLILPVTLSSQEKPAETAKAGYDIGACSPENFYVVHLNTVNDDLSLVLYMGKPGEVEVPDEPILYKFQKEEVDGRHYLSAAGVELIFKFKEDYAIGVQKRNGEVHAVVYGVKADGSEIQKNAQTFAGVCQDLRDDKGEDSVPAPQQSEDNGYEMPNFFGRGGPIVKI